MGRTRKSNKRKAPISKFEGKKPKEYDDSSDFEMDPNSRDKRDVEGIHSNTEHSTRKLRSSILKAPNSKSEGKKPKEDNSSSEFELDPNPSGKNRAEETSTRNVRRSNIVSLSESEHKVPVNCFGLLTVVSKDCYFRSNVKSTIKELNAANFTEQDLIELKKTPFWPLFSALRKLNNDQKNKLSKHDDDIRKILMSFDINSSTFIIAGMQLKITPRDVEEIFGIGGKSRQIPFKGSEYKQTPWVLRCFAKGGNGTLCSKLIREKLVEAMGRKDENRCSDIARLLICTMLTSLLTPHQSGSMPWHLTSILEEISGIKEFAWSTYIIEMLLDQIRSSKNLKVGGCAMLLPFWICEKTRLVKESGKRVVPKFLRWDLNDLNKELVKQNEVYLHQLNKKYVVECNAESTHAENIDCGVMNKLVEEKDGAITCMQPKNDNVDHKAMDLDYLDDMPKFSLCLTQYDTPVKKNNVMHGETGGVKNPTEDEGGPSMTQICSSEENVQLMQTINDLARERKKNEVLMEENKRLAEENEKLLIELERFKDQQAQPKQNSMIRGVKLRTAKGERVPKLLTPTDKLPHVLNLDRVTNELESDSEDTTRRKGENKLGPFKIDTSCLAVKKSEDYIIETVKEQWEAGDSGMYCWGREGTMAQVTVLNLVEILEHKRISSNVVDAWGDITMSKYGRHNKSELPAVFSSCCLDLIERSNTGKGGNLKKLIDQHIDDEIQKDEFVFPLLSTVDHWTILKLDLQSGQWLFYNSLRPRRKTAVDKNMKKVMALVEYVVPKIVNSLRSRRKEHHFIHSASKNVVHVDCIQQPWASVDCGVVVCMNMESMVKREQVKTGELTDDEAANYRKKMVEWVVDPTTHGVLG